MRTQIASQPDAWWGAQTGREREDGGVRLSNKAWFSFKNSWGLGPVAFLFLFGK